MKKFSIIVGSFLILFTINANAQYNLTIDPGAVGSVSGYENFDFSSFSGITYSGQTLSLDVRFDDSKFAVAPGINIGLFMNQSGPLGTWPTTTGFSITAQLLDAHGDPFGPSYGMGLDGESPAQIWPGWPFTLGGAPFFPATADFATVFLGNIVWITPRIYDVDPIVFSGIHLDITLPNDPSDSILGTRLQLAAGPMYISPDTMPLFQGNLPDTSSTLVLLGLGLSTIVFFKKSIRK